MTSNCWVNGRRDVDSMTVQRELLKRHVESLEGRLNTLDNFSNAKVSAIGGDPDELSLKFEEVSEQVPHMSDNVDNS